MALANIARPPEVAIPDHRMAALRIAAGGILCQQRSDFGLNRLR
jgi:hypothetical protein